MPQIYGHHLTYCVKIDSRLKGIPVIIFSSLITDDLYYKGENVGAISQVSKPNLVNLVKEIDKYNFIKMDNTMSNVIWKSFTATLKGFPSSRFLS